MHPLAGNFHVPTPQNEPVREYRPGSVEAEAVATEIRRLGAMTQAVPLSIGGALIETERTQPVVSPHDHARVLGNL